MFDISDFCFLSDLSLVPHGGYVTSTFLSVAKSHFATVRASCDQPHTIAVQLTFLRRSSLGPATFTVTESKLGRRTSTLHIALTQGEDLLPLVLGFFTQSNINNEIGVSLPVSYELFPPRPPLTSKEALCDGTDPEWVLHENHFSKFRKAGQHLLSFIPRNGQARPGLVDLWLTMRGQRFTQESLGYVVDSFPQLVETAETSGDLEKEMERLHIDGDKFKESGYWAKFWYPTVLLNMEVKKVLPPDGAEWLLSRVTTTQICNGRMDIEVTILDEEGGLVALSNHVALIVPAERNMKRGNKGRSGEGSKL